MRLRIDVDARTLIAALERFPAAAEHHCYRAARVTADRIKTDALSRVARRTGQTASGITVDTAERDTGFVVYASNVDEPGLPGWLEFGTKHMRARRFLFIAAMLEEGAHDRRMREAIQDAINEEGG